MSYKRISDWNKVLGFLNKNNQKASFQQEIFDAEDELDKHEAARGYQKTTIQTSQQTLNAWEPKKGVGEESVSLLPVTSFHKLD